MRAALVALVLLGAIALPGRIHGAPPEESVDLLPMGPSPEARLDEIRRRVQEAVVYPARARELGLEGTARIQFQVGNDGHAEGVGTVQSSGHSVLDRAAERGAIDAGRLPPLYGRIRIPVRFDLEGRE